MTNEEVNCALHEHVARYWCDRRLDLFTWELGTFQQDYPSWRTARVPQVLSGERWAYVTLGAWEAESASRFGHEFILHSPIEEPLHVQLMASLTRYVAAQHAPIGVGSIIPVGEPWLEGSHSDHILLARPYSYPESFEHLQLNSLAIHFLWLVPITAAEAEYSQHYGLERLEDLLESSGVDVTDPNRPSLVQPSDLLG